MKEKTVYDKIMDRLRTADRPLAVHEFQILGVSENGLAARLREMTQEGKLTNSYRKGQRVKEWGLPEWSEPKQLALIEGVTPPAWTTTND